MPLAAKMVRQRSKGYVMAVAQTPAKAPDVKDIAVATCLLSLGGFLLFSCNSWRNSEAYPYTQNCETLYPIHKQDAATFPLYNDTTPPSLSAILYRFWNICHSPPMKPPFTDTEVASEGCSCLRILRRSRGAVMQRAPRPETAPATISCQCGYGCAF